MGKTSKSARPAKAAASNGGRAANRPSRGEAESAVRTLIRWAGDDPDREGLLATPSRVARAYEEWFAGYDEDPRDYLKRTFEEVAGYDEIVLLRDVRFVSHCETGQRAGFLENRGIGQGRGAAAVCFGRCV